MKHPLPLYLLYPPNIMGLFFNKFAKDFTLGKCFGHGLYQNQTHIWLHHTLEGLGIYPTPNIVPSKRASNKKLLL